MIDGLREHPLVEVDPPTVAIYPELGKIVRHRGVQYACVADCNNTQGRGHTMLVPVFQSFATTRREFRFQFYVNECKGGLARNEWPATVMPDRTTFKLTG